MSRFKCPSCFQEIDRNLPVKRFSAGEKGFYVDVESRYCPECQTPLKPNFRCSGFFEVIIILVIGLPIVILAEISFLWAILPIAIWRVYYHHRIETDIQPYSIDERF